MASSASAAVVVVQKSSAQKFRARSAAICWAVKEVNRSAAVIWPSAGASGAGIEILMGVLESQRLRRALRGKNRPLGRILGCQALSIRCWRPNSMRPSSSRWATMRTSASRSSCSDCEVITPMRRAPTMPAQAKAAARATDLSRRVRRARMGEDGMRVTSERGLLVSDGHGTAWAQAIDVSKHIQALWRKHGSNLDRRIDGDAGCCDRNERVSRGGQDAQRV